MSDLPTNIREKLDKVKLYELEALDLSNTRSMFAENEFTKMLAEVFELKHLKILILRDNQLTHIPNTISRLHDLTILDLGNNRLATLPDSIGRLKRLEILFLYNNELTEIPDSIAQLVNLKELFMQDNHFMFFPDVLYRLSSLETLDLSNYSRRDGLNQICKISEKIMQLSKLRELTLKNNPLEFPPVEIVEQGVSAIAEYFKQLEVAGTDYLYEAKLLIVGEGGAGKTSLARKIENPSYKLCDSESSTKGIEVIRWSFPMSDGRRFQVNIWDFGGQEIYHATHQFFLTKRSMYALVADTRKEDTDFYYWLNVIELLSDNSPLIIVKNEKQDRRREINENHLRGRFSNLKETMATNLATDRGVPEIIDEIKHYISHLPHIGSPLPTTWVKVRETLEKDPRNHITLEEYLRICDRSGFKRREDKMQLSGYLHDLGVCLHFQDDPLLRKTVILKPKWGTEAVYKVVDNEKVIHNLGEFDRSDLAEIWCEPEYADMRYELLQLMINFGLCYKIPGSSSYIAPQLLTENQPRYHWEESDNLILRYTYEFMPKGIITQFIVAVHTRIVEQRLVWRSGVVIENDATHAEIIEDYDKREIKIRVAGKHKIELRAIVTHELDRIHASYRRLKYNKMIPCNCVKCKTSQEPHFYAFEVLRQFSEDGEEHIQCQKSYRMVNVKTLIDDTITHSKMGSSAFAKGHKEPPLVPNTIFISYSHKDIEWLRRLKTMLKPIFANNNISAWDDMEIKAGARWQQELRNALTTAKVAVLLVSPNFLASDFIMKYELPELIKVTKEKNLRIIWIALSASFYEETEIAEYQAANDPFAPLDSLKRAELNRTMKDICDKIKIAASSKSSFS